MYSRSTGYPTNTNRHSASNLHPGVRIPANYGGTAIGTHPPDGVPPATDGVTLPDVTADALSEAPGTPPQPSIEERQDGKRAEVGPAPPTSPLKGLLLGQHFPFGHGLGYEELLILGLILCLLREGGDHGEDDLSVTVLLLGALLFLG